MSPNIIEPGEKNCAYRFGIQFMQSDKLAPARSLTLLISIFALTTSSILFGATPELYLSPSGDDSQSGTRDHPIRTLQYARDLVRTMNQHMESDITIFIEKGVYRLSTPLLFEARDSGANGHNIIYKGMGDERPIISGGVQITGWKLSNPEKNIWAAPAPANLKNTRQFYIDGVRRPRTSCRPPTSLSQTATGYEAGSDFMSHWRNPGDIEFVYTGGDSIWTERSAGMGGWTEPRCPVAAIKGKTITMAQPCWDNSTKRVPLPPDSPFHRPANLVGPATLQGKEPAYIENVFELLGTPGQWYFDRPGKMFYYVGNPGENPNNEDVEVPVLETLIVGQGQPGNPVQNIIFTGLQFSYATWLFPSSGEGFSEIQANYLVTGPDGYDRQGLSTLVPGGKEPFAGWTKSAANVSFSYDQHVQFSNDTFAHLGAAGLGLGNGSQFDTVEGCVFTDTSGCGITLGDVIFPNADKNQVTADNRISNNHIYNIGAEFHGAIGICVGYAQRTVIQHNQIDHVPYSGISIGWGGWLDKIQRPGLANNSENNFLAANLIFNHMLLLSDGGGIYNQGLTGQDLANGEKIIGNVIRDQFGHGHGIYTDNGSGLITIKSNIFQNPNHDNWAAPRTDYRDGKKDKKKIPFDVQNNYWQGNPYATDGALVVQGNHIISTYTQAPAGLVQNAGLEPVFHPILSERFGKPTVPEAPRRVCAAVGKDAAIVCWNPPVFDGDSPITSYVVASSKGNTATISASDFERFGYAKMTGLSEGEAWTFSVRAINRQGMSAPSLPSRAVVLSSKQPKLPEAPVFSSAVLADGRASISFHAPENTGGSPVLAYKFIIDPGHHEVTMTGRTAIAVDGRHSTYFTIDGLKNGSNYTCTLSAVNDVGEGPAATSLLKPSNE